MEHCGAFWNPWNPCRTLWNPAKSQGRPGPSHSPRTISWKPETLIEPHLKPPRPPRSPRRTSWNPARTLLEPSWNHTLQNLVEPWWNPRGTLPQTTPNHPAALVERSWNLTSNHPGPPRSPRRWCNPGKTLVDKPPRSLSGLRPQSFQLLGKMFGKNHEKIKLNRWKRPTVAADKMEAEELAVRSTKPC